MMINHRKPLILRAGPVGRARAKKNADAEGYS
jgi:hypothetical protein